MSKVPYGEDRTPLDLTRLRHVGPPVGWAALWPYGGKEIALRIDGDERGPYARLLELAELVLPKLSELEQASDSYLRTFARHADDFYKGSWKIQSVRMYWTPGSGLPMGSEFEVTLWIAEDDYGEWGVRFIRETYPAREFRPFVFSRRQW